MKYSPNHLSAIRQSYRDLAPFSDKYNVDRRRYAFTVEIISQLPNAEHLRILDIGTGVGILPYCLSKLGYQAEGADLFIFPEHENDMFRFQDIDILRDKWSAAGVIITNTNIYTHDLPWPDESYDVLISEAMIEHLKDPGQYLAQMKRLLRPGGYMIITTPNLTTLLKRVRFLFGLSPNWPIAEFYRDGESFTGHWREYTMSELRTMCELADLEIVKTYDVNLLARFKSWRAWKKNITALFVMLSWLVPGSREMLYVIAKKRE